MRNLKHVKDYFIGFIQTLGLPETFDTTNHTRTTLRNLLRFILYKTFIKEKLSGKEYDLIYNMLLKHKTDIKENTDIFADFDSFNYKCFYYINNNNEIEDFSISKIVNQTEVNSRIKKAKAKIYLCFKNNIDNTKLITIPYVENNIDYLFETLEEYNLKIWHPIIKKDEELSVKEYFNILYDLLKEEKENQFIHIYLDIRKSYNEFKEDIC